MAADDNRVFLISKDSVLVPQMVRNLSSSETSVRPGAETPKSIDHEAVIGRSDSKFQGTGTPSVAR
jgi:hypothetical protein